MSTDKGEVEDVNSLVEKLINSSGAEDWSVEKRAKMRQALLKENKQITYNITLMNNLNS